MFNCVTKYHLSYRSGSHASTELKRNLAQKHAASRNGSASHHQNIQGNNRATEDTRWYWAHVLYSSRGVHTPRCSYWPQVKLSLPTHGCSKTALCRVINQKYTGAVISLTNSEQGSSLCHTVLCRRVKILRKQVDSIKHLTILEWNL